MSLEVHLKQIRANLDDPAPYLVLADWLQEQGNPWGRLIMLQHELEQRPGDSAVAAEADALLRKHKWAPKHKPELLRLDWRWGFIRGIRLFDEYASENLDEVLGPVLALPMAALVRSCLIFREPERVDAGEAPAVLDRLPAGAVVEHVGPLTLHTEDPEERLAQLRAASPDTRWVDVHHAVPAELVCFKQLALLTCQGVAALPTELGALPLERIDVDWCGELTSIPDAVWGIESLGHISMYDCDGLGLNMGQVNNLLLGFVRARTPRKQRIVEAALMRGGSPRASTGQLLYALDSNVGTVRTRALELLGKQLESPLARHPIQPGSVIALLGSVNIDSKVLKARIEGVGATLSTRVTDGTTHVLVGEKPGGKQHAVGQLPLMVEPHIVALGKGVQSGARETETRAPDRAVKGRKKATVAAGSGPDLARLALDLRSKKDGRICAAVQALQEHGGIPAELIPELFVVLQNTELEKLGKGRKQARKLFAAYAPAKLKSTVARHFKTSMLLAGETKRAERLTALERGAGAHIEMKHLARVLVEDFGCGLKFVLARGDGAEIHWALEQRIKGRRIDLSTCELERLPDLSAFDLQEVDASNNHLTAFPAELSALPSLTTVNLSANYLRSLPRNMAQLESLRRLDLSCNRFQTFPAGVLTLAGLEELDLSSDTWGETRITKIPPQIVALTRLKVLKINNGHAAVQVPPQMASMTWLRCFEVTWEGASSKPPAALTALLPKCKIS